MLSYPPVCLLTVVPMNVSLLHFPHRLPSTHSEAKKFLFINFLETNKRVMSVRRSGRSHVKSRGGDDVADHHLTER
jgi:hypothetical protein